MANTNRMQARIDYYDLKNNLENCGDIKSHQFEPDARVRVRVKETKQIIEVPAAEIFPHLHTVFLGEDEFNVLNRASKYLGNGELEGGSGSSGEPLEESKAKCKEVTPSTKKSKSKASKRDGCD